MTSNVHSVVIAWCLNDSHHYIHPNIEVCNLNIGDFFLIPDSSAFLEEYVILSFITGPILPLILNASTTKVDAD